MKAKDEYIEATTKALKDSRDLGEKELKKFKELPDSNELSEFFDVLNELLAEIENISANDLAFLQIQRPVFVKIDDPIKLQQAQKEIPSSLINLMNLAKTKLNDEFLRKNALKNKIIHVSRDEKMDFYECVLANLPVTQAQYQMMDFIMTNYYQVVDITTDNPAFYDFCAMIILKNKDKYLNQPKSKKIADTDTDTDKITDLIKGANSNLDQYQNELEEKIYKDVFKNKDVYSPIIDSEKNKEFKDVDVHSINFNIKRSAIIKFLSHKTIRAQLIEKEESILLPRKAGEISSEVIDDLLRYAVIQEARKKLNDSTTMQVTKRFQNAGEFLERNEAIITRSRDSFYRTMGKGLLAFFTAGFALIAYLLAEDKDAKLSKQFNYRNSFFYKETEANEEKSAIPSAKSGPGQSGQ